MTEREDGAGDLLFRTTPTISGVTRLEGVLGTGLEGYLGIGDVQQMVIHPFVSPKPGPAGGERRSTDKGVISDRELDG